MNCATCNGTGWEIAETGARRCACRRKPKPQRKPISSEAIAWAVEALGALSFYPRQTRERAMIGEALAAMCGSVDELRHVVRRAVGLYKTWNECGIPGLRQILCSRYRPADGIESGPTLMFPDGLPPETATQSQLAAAEMKLLPAGDPVSRDEGVETAFHIAAKVIDLKNRAFSGPATAEEIRNAPEWLKEIERGYGR